jgi:hypothetical protein
MVERTIFWPYGTKYSSTSPAHQVKTTTSPTQIGRPKYHRNMTTLDALRVRAQDLGNTDPHGFLELLPQLREDHELAQLWLANGAQLAWQLQRKEEARKLLDEAIAHGFFQPLIFDGLAGMLEEQPDTKSLWAQIKANTPDVPLELLDFPDPAPHFPIKLGSIASEREEQLKAMLPPPAPTALGTALSLLNWTHTRWSHAGANRHAVDLDALSILEQVAQGERFRCVEYGKVLAAALCARGIPARILTLRLDSYHAGIGAGHVVTEAWIDELNDWVALDGQNGAYWAVEPGQPLSTQELHRRFRAGEQRPEFWTTEGEACESPEIWWMYFAWTVNGMENARDEEPFVPVFEGEPLSTPRLTRHVQATRPNLSEFSIGFGKHNGKLVMTFAPLHPFAVGVAVNGMDVLASGQPLEAPAGEHEWRVQVRTLFGLLDAHRVIFRVNT